MDTFIERQGFYDYINHFVTGAIFVFGIEIILFPFKYSLVQKLYEAIIIFCCLDKNSFLWNVCILLIYSILCFLLGVLIQELYSLLYENKPNQNADKMKRSSISRLWRKVNKNDYIANLFVDNSLIQNSLKRNLYRKYACEITDKKQSEILNKKGNDEIRDEDLPVYFYAYCVYYIQVRKQDKKTEKLRDIEGMSMSFSLAFLILTLVSFGATYLGLLGRLSNQMILFELMCSFMFASFSIISDYRAEKALKNRIRITLAVYEAEKERENASSSL